jgi:hypothetical protein
MLRGHGRASARKDVLFLKKNQKTLAALVRAGRFSARQEEQNLLLFSRKKRLLILALVTLAIPPAAK